MGHPLALLLSALAIGPRAAVAAEKRATPDYDGRGGPTDGPERKALLPVRLLLSPAYFVSEFVLRRPLGFAITAAEKAGLPRALYDFFAFGPDHKAGIVPIAFIDFGFEPSAGLYAFWDDAGFEGHQLRLHGTTWGRDWLSGSATERFLLGRLELTLNGGAVRRPDYAFYGIGPDTREASLVRYASDSVDAFVEARFHFAGDSLLEAASGYRGASFHHSRYGGSPAASAYEPSLDDAVASGALPLPPGYTEGYRASYTRLRLVLDSRQSSGSASGGRLDLTAAEAENFASTPGSGWLRYGATVGGFLDLADSGRVISLSLAAQFADPLRAGTVPFNELVTLGGAALMPGFRMGRLYDRSAMVATLRYSWPVWIWLNGSLQAAVGNVFGEHLSGLRAERSRLAAAIGLESSGSRDSIFQALVGFGTETFESGAALNSIRIVVGARRGF